MLRFDNMRHIFLSTQYVVGAVPWDTKMKTAQALPRASAVSYSFAKGGRIS